MAVADVSAAETIATATKSDRATFVNDRRGASREAPRLYRIFLRSPLLLLPVLC